MNIEQFPTARELLKADFKHFKYVNNTPAIPLIAAAWIEMLETGNGPQELLGSWDLKTILAVHPETGESMGCILYQFVEYRRSVWINLSYVAPKYRKQKLYTAMFAELVKIAQKEEYWIIEGGIGINNDAMIAAAKSVGRIPQYVTTTFKIQKPSKVEEPADPASHSGVGRNE